MLILGVIMAPPPPVIVMLAPPDMLTIMGLVSLLPAAQDGAVMSERVTVSSEGVVLGHAGWMVRVEVGVDREALGRRVSRRVRKREEKVGSRGEGDGLCGKCACGEGCDGEDGGGEFHVDVLFLFYLLDSHKVGLCLR